MGQGRFIAVVGPSGVGKDSVMSALAEAEPNASLLRRVITRALEAGGEDYEPVTVAEFTVRRETGEFALHWQAHGLHYGIPASIDEDLAGGRDMLVNLSRSVLSQARARFDRFLCLSITAPKSVLAQRLAARGRETAEEIERRLSRSEFQIPEDMQVSKVDNSGSLSETVKAIRSMLYPVKV